MTVILLARNKHNGSVIKRCELKNNIKQKGDTEMFRNKFNPTMIAVVLIALLCFFLPGCVEKKEEVKQINVLPTEIKQHIKDEMKQCYYDGFNDALENLALLNLEFELKGIRKNYGEMFDTLRTRWHIPQGKK